MNHLHLKPFSHTFELRAQVRLSTAVSTSASYHKTLEKTKLPLKMHIFKTKAGGTLVKQQCHQYNDEKTMSEDNWSNKIMGINGTIKMEMT